MGLTRRSAKLLRGANLKQPLEQRPTGVILDDSPAEARCCGVRAVETLAVGLHQDDAVVRAALTLPWSNGQALDQITKFKINEAADVRPSPLRLASSPHSSRLRRAMHCAAVGGHSRL